MAVVEVGRIREIRGVVGTGDSGGVCLHRKLGSEPRTLSLEQSASDPGKSPCRQTGVQLKDPETEHRDALAPMSWSLS